MMVVHGVDRELAQRAHDARLMEGLDHQILVHAFGGDDLPVLQRDSEVDALAGQDMIAIWSVLMFESERLGLEVGRHFPGQHLDRPGAEHTEGVALVAELRRDREGDRIQGLGENEHVVDHPTATAGPRIAVTVGAAARIRRRDPGERRLAPGTRRAGPRGGGPTLAVADVEDGGEQDATRVEDFAERELSADDLVLLDVAG
jgi:hypothetical protein